MSVIRVRTNKGEFVAEVVKDNPKTFWVKLPDGHIIKRDKRRHVVKED